MASVGPAVVAQQVPRAVSVVPALPMVKTVAPSVAPVVVIEADVGAFSVGFDLVKKLASAE